MHSQNCRGLRETERKTLCVSAPLRLGVRNSFCYSSSCRTCLDCWPKLTAEARRRRGEFGSASVQWQILPELWHSLRLAPVVLGASKPASGIFRASQPSPTLLL